MQAQRNKTIANDDVTQQTTAHTILKKINQLKKQTLKLAEKFDHPFSHLFVFGNIFADIFQKQAILCLSVALED